MKTDRDAQPETGRKKGGGWAMFGVVMAGLLAVSLGFNFSLFTKEREGVFDNNQVLGQAMTLIQSADSQLNDAIRKIEGGADASQSLYAVGEVRVRLSQASGLMLSLREDISRQADKLTAADMMPATLRAFDAYLGNELAGSWQEGDAALDASREETLKELRAMKLDLAQLAGLSQDHNRQPYRLDEFLGRWESVMRQRVQEDPDTELHRGIGFLYGM
ncbi:hypothetical protein [Saccharibacillus alkalitolerans]|uniref:Methyl-accepting chemotaxis protein n=1 Tax=Saccharibacillus alkalitolerans TaxID=2705290 RepID=A0ABX0F857_9BACL|nr:hypothetical protein [Saccharibacillus alkalitolerans]NGZ76625.1 hypothetical protein [Saccharibacillus alkalitolerans]